MASYPYSFEEEAPPTIVKRTSTRSNNPYLPGRNSLNQSTSLNSSVTTGSPMGSYIPAQSHPDIYYQPHSHSHSHHSSFPQSYPELPPYQAGYASPQSPVFRAPLLLRPSSNFKPTPSHAKGNNTAAAAANNDERNATKSLNHPSTYPGEANNNRSPSSSSSCDSFALGSGGQPRPFKSRPTLSRPLKAKWERRRNQLKKKLLKTLNIPEEQRLIDTIPACQEMVDAIRTDIYATLHSINNQYEEAKGKTPTPTDRLPTLPPPAAKDSCIQPQAGSSGRTPAPKPPPGHKSFRTALQERHRIVVSVMFVGLDSAKPSPQLELIIFVTHDAVYVVSMATLGATAFTDGGLASFFEDPLISKITFDCRPDAEVLWKVYGVRQQGLCDLQVLATMALSPTGQYMISRRTMFQRIGLDHFSDTDVPCHGGAQLSLRDARYLIVAFFMFDHFEQEGRTIAKDRVNKVISGDYTKCHIRDF